MLYSMSPSESPNLGVVLGTLNTPSMEPCLICRLIRYIHHVCVGGVGGEFVFKRTMLLGN